MANIINGTDTGSGGLITTGDSSDELQLQTAETARVTLTNTAVVVNEDGNDVDFRVESDTNANALFVEGSSGNVGIGTSSPSYPLHVNSSASLASIGLTGGAAGKTDFRIMQGITGVSNGGFSLYDLTNSATRMVIDSNGTFLVGTTTASNGSHTFKNPTNTRIAFNNDGASPFGIIIGYAQDPNGTSNEFLFCTSNAGATARMVVRSNGGIANYSANDVNLSDRREKTNFAPAKNYLNTICAIPVQTFNYIDQNLEEDDGLTLGVVAQDVQEVAPELVMESNWGTEEEPKMRLSIYQTDLQYALMKCIQELKAELDEAKTRIAALETGA